MKTKLLLLAGFLMTVCAGSQAQPATHPYKEMENELMQEVNAYRKSIGQRPLKVSIFVSNIAERHSRNMASKKIEYGNEGFKDRTDKIYTQLKPVYSFAENIDTTKLSAKEVLQAWLNSPKHKKNLDGDYNYSGIGIAKSADSTCYITQIFILKD